MSSEGKEYDPVDLLRATHFRLLQGEVVAALNLIASARRMHTIEIRDRLLAMATEKHAKLQSRLASLPAGLREELAEGLARVADALATARREFDEA